MPTADKDKPQNPSMKALDSFIKRVLDYKPAKPKRK